MSPAPWLTAALAACLLAPNPDAHAQTPSADGPPDSARFLSAAREAAGRYADPSRALAEGYARVGPDAPAMGAHWVHIGHVADGIFDPAHPSFLAYIDVAGGPVLAGVGFALAVDAQENPPAAPTGAQWHTHAGTVAEEVREHDDAPGHEDRGPRVAVLHAWVGIENPAGIFATENWSLPWVRLGLVPPADAPADASRAAAMAAGLEAFYRDSWSSEAPGSRDRAAVALAEAAERARAIIAAIAPGSAPSTAALAALAAETRRAREGAAADP